MFDPNGLPPTFMGRYQDDDTLNSESTDVPFNVSLTTHFTVLYHLSAEKSLWHVRQQDRYDRNHETGYHFQHVG